MKRALIAEKLYKNVLRLPIFNFQNNSQRLQNPQPPIYPHSLQMHTKILWWGCKTFTICVVMFFLVLLLSFILVITIYTSCRYWCVFCISMFILLLLVCTNKIYVCYFSSFALLRENILLKWRRILFKWDFYYVFWSHDFTLNRIH